MKSNGSLRPDHFSDNYVLKTSFKYHFLLAFILGIWIILFLVIIGPFDAAPLTFEQRAQIMYGYGILFMVSYIMTLPFQYLWYRKFKTWTLWTEIGFIVLFFLVCWPFTFWYYQGGIVNGDYPFAKFSWEVYFPTLAILFPLLLFARKMVSRYSMAKEFKGDKKMTLTGEHKLDILRVEPSKLICISAANNYVEIYYEANGELKKKLLRSTLKKMQEELNFLVQIHRSHLINPRHFTKWIDTNTIALGSIHLPVSKKHKAHLVSIENFIPNR